MCYCECGDGDGPDPAAGWMGHLPGQGAGAAGGRGHSEVVALGRRPGVHAG